MYTVRPQKGRRAGLLRTFAFVLTVFIVSAPIAAQQPQPTPTPVDNEYQVSAILWTQTAGEWRALCYQAFTLAHMALNNDLKTHKSKKERRALVVDVDETVLDNSPQQARLVKEHQGFNQTEWAKWTASAQAEAIPGAAEFLNYADKKGVRVFYITNRNESERAGTMANLQKVGFPNVTNESVLLRADTSSKEPRRQQVVAQYRIVLLMGDNLNDFDVAFEKKTVAERLAAVEQNKDKFGTRYIVLPNAMYGDWESAIYSNPTPNESRTERRHNTLKAFTPPQ
jgi:5'-nucleotidase (lipoprotein e(P4) family)